MTTSLLSPKYQVVIPKEIRKAALKQRTLEKADEVTQAMRSGIVVTIDEEIAIAAADIFIQCKLSLADSLIYAITLARKATLWTQDPHFERLPQVRYFPNIKP
ncbi:MAG: PIN domain-containing protein [Luteolibacter sp.]|nr:PIN domain-containing protein [Luteolibacter sp.]